MNGRYIYNLTQEPLPFSIGNKANNLRKICQMGEKVPVTYCCTWEAYSVFQTDGEQVLQHLREEISDVIDLRKSYAVRSSTDLEDHHRYSFAGQFTTVLDVSGLDAILHSIQEVWESGQFEGVQSYQERIGDEPSLPKMAVIIQEMVPPLLSGVVFSKNPLTGQNETIVEAVEGPGTLLVQDGLTPLRWIHRWGAWHEQPSEKRAYTTVVQEVVDRTKEIVRRYGKELDLEWVYDGQEIHWVQLREITTLEDVHIYSNKISKEFLPGMIKPLVWSVNVPLVNGSWVKLLTEVIGRNEIEPESLARSFYYRAYFDTSTFGKIFDLLGMPRQSLEINMGIVEPPENRPAFRPTGKMIRLLPRLLPFLYDKWRFAAKVEKRFPKIESRLQQFADLPSNSLSHDELLGKIDQLYQVAQEAAYYNIVVPLLMYAYNAALRGQLKHFELDFAQFDVTRNLKSLDAYAPDVSLERLRLDFRSLDPDIQKRILKSDYASFQQIPGIEPFRTAVRRFINQFGHLSDSGNDFSVPPWREDPDLILSLIASYQSSESKQAVKVGFEDLPARGPRRWLTGLFYRRARRFRYYREWVSSVYTFGYGLFRDLYLALGECLVIDGFLSDREDIFYLYHHEIREVVAGAIGREAVEEKITHRKLEMLEYQAIELPEVIYGDDPPPPGLPAVGKLRGTPTSPGVYTGKARVVRGLGDFHKVDDGDVIVIPYSDVGWTPLFNKAGAVVAESGGILSHSSIVAREYNIPAVVSVANALMIENSAVVTVDGYRGDVLIHETVDDEGAKPRRLIAG